MSEHSTVEGPRWYRTRNGRLLLAALVALGLYLLTDHWTHAVSYLPWLLVLACPLLHVFMHGGHGGHSGHGGHGGADKAGTPRQGD